jgi:preprotein translocase subunit SecA
MDRGIAHPGSIWGAYPERSADGRARPRRMAWATAHSEQQHYVALAASAQQYAERLSSQPPLELYASSRRIAAQLSVQGFQPNLLAQLLGCVAAQVFRAMGVRVFPTQLVCAAALLDQHMAEMATGEGKTLAAGMAAAVGGLVGTPVHVLTANEYLAERDAQSLTPLYESLRLSAALAREQAPPAERQVAYQADIVYATARTIAFDYLRDKLVRTSTRSDLSLRISASSQHLMLRGLCMVIIDEADSILIDEAKMPLVISEAVADTALRSRSWQALDLARRLDNRDYLLNRQSRQISLTESGRNKVEALALEYGTIWLNRMHREELITQALTALRGLHRDHDYLIEDQQIVIIDAISGRSAPGRIWSRGLHTAVALKEGLEPPPATQTQAQITYPRLFSRYHHLCGLSGTLNEVARELRDSYEIETVAIPLFRPSRRRQMPARVLRSRVELFRAAARRAQQVLARCRPLLITVDSVLDSRLLVSILAGRAIPHTVLNAQTAADEASVVAGAGNRVQVTVATQMAGRGTDIELSEAVRAAGGLHVLNLQHNRSRRLDRQIAGRAGRQGQPGTYEHWVCLETPLLHTSWLAAGFERLAPRRLQVGALAYRVVRRAQRLAEREDAALRKATSRQDRDWSRSLHFTTMTE